MLDHFKVLRLESLSMPQNCQGRNLLDIVIGASHLGS